MTSAPALPICASVFRLPKRGSRRTEDEDAVAVSKCGRRFAVADGASASAFARLWAHLLVHAYCGGKLDVPTLENDLKPMQTRWEVLVSRRPLPWYAQEQVRRGAFAALVGLTVEPEQRWHALAVGDCCLFQLRAGEMVTAFPLSDPEEFTLRPVLLGSRPLANANLRQAGGIRVAHGKWQAGDTFLMMSDALAVAFLRGCAFDLESTRRFTACVQERRATGELRNDDVALVRLQFRSDAAA